MKGLVKLAKAGEPHAGSMVCTSCGHLPSKHVNETVYGSVDVATFCTIKHCPCRRVLEARSA